MVDIWLPYGRTEVHASITSENLMEVIGLSDKPGVKDVAGEVERAVKELISSEKMIKAVETRGKIALALNVFDVSLARLILSSVTREATCAGLRSEDLVVVIANNPLMTRADDAIKRLKEEVISLGVNIVVHDPTHNNIYICDLEDGVKVYLDRAFAETDVKIVISTIEPNPYTLYNCCESGVAFGLTSLETIKGIILPILDSDDFQEKAFKESVRILGIAKLDLSLGIVKNLRNDVVRCFSGDPERVLRESLEDVNSIYGVALKEQPNIIVISPGGFPFDADIFSACMCLENALKVVRNGSIILVAECSEGYGKPEYYQVIRKVDGDLSLLEKMLKSEFSIEGLIVYRFLRAFRKASIIMVSSIPDYYASKIPGLKIFRSVNDALNDALNKFGAKAKVIVAPHGVFIPHIEKQK